MQTLGLLMSRSGSLKNRILALTLLQWGCLLVVHAGNEGFGTGPRSLGAGQVTSLFADAWSVHNNPGALGWIRRSVVTTAYDSRYGNPAFSQLSAACALPHARYGTLGIGASRFGNEIFSQTRAMGAWAKTFGIASVGLQAQYYGVQATEFPARHHFILGFGGLARLTPALQFGAAISNITQTKASTYDNETLPTIVRGGILYAPVKSVKLLAEVQKDLDRETLVKGGLEYEFQENFWLRTGFTTHTKVASGGFSFRWRDFDFDYGVSHHPELGWSHGIGIQFRFGKDSSLPSNTGPATPDPEK